MTLVFLRSYSKARNNMISYRSNNSLSQWATLFSRNSSDDKTTHPEFTNSTILIENGYNVHELPVIVRKLTDLNKLDHIQTNELSRNTNESLNYHLIQEEFKQCMDLREVFSLITKCTKITPNIALGAIERIFNLEKQGDDSKVEDLSVHINYAKGAILDKLQKVVMKTEDTQTILNVLKTNSSIMEPFKYTFSGELLMRAIDNKLTLGQLCDFATFLINNNTNQKYSETVDRLWVSFIDKENDINEHNIAHIFNILPGLKVSKRTLSILLEQKLSEIWYNIKPQSMQEILNIFISEKYFSMQSFAVLSHWLYLNIHSLDEDSLLDIVTKFTHLKYSDDRIVASVEKYMRLKGLKVSSHVLIAGLYNFCMEFQLSNEQILNTCSLYFISNMDKIPSSFLRCFIYPHGYLYSEPARGIRYWECVEELLLRRFEKIGVDDMCLIVLTFVYLGHHPLKLIPKIFNPEYVAKIKNPETYKKLQLIDTALSLECKTISGPMLPKDQCHSTITQDIRIRNILFKTKNSFVKAVGSSDMFSTAVSIPNYCSDRSYLIDVMIHPPGLGSTTFNWKLKSDKCNITAVLIHLPDHFCSDGKTLIGPQAMRIRHMKILGLKVVSLKYSLLSQLYTSQDTNVLEKYISDSIKNELPLQHM